MSQKSQIKDIIEWIYCIIIAIVLALLFRYFIGTPTVVMHSSMEPTLMPGQRLWINRFAKTINSPLKYGDIVTFEAPENKTLPATGDNNGVNVTAKYTTRKGLKRFLYNFLEINKTSYIKRIIGLPGDKIEIKDDKVYRNGQEVDEWYLPSGTVTRAETEVMKEFTVPDGTFFALGDNRPKSIDSRYFGCIPYEKLESKVFIRIWPLNLLGKIDKKN